MNSALFPALALATATLCASAAQGAVAVSVIGGSSAQICYEAADQHLPPPRYFAYCDDALSGVLTPNDRAATFINRGVLKMNSGRYNSAVDDFNTGLAINETMGEGYVDRGATLIGLKRYAEAIDDIDRGLSLGAKQPHVAYYDRAMAHEGLGDVRAAYEDYRHALEIAPNFTMASDELKRFKVTTKTTGS